MNAATREGRSRRALAVLTTAAALAGCVASGAGPGGASALASAGAGTAAAEEVYPVPVDGVFRLTGRGFGHGAGMSQHGARGGADRGASTETILATYYPGTLATTVPEAERTLRVALAPGGGSADTCSSAAPPAAAPCFVVLPPGSAPVAQARVGSGAWVAIPTSTGGESVTAYAVAAASTTTFGLWLRTESGAWVQWTGLGTGATLDLRRSDEGVSPLTVVDPVTSEQKSYRGMLRAVRVFSTTLARVNELALDTYLRGVVPAEMPTSWAAAAVRAQAVAARTYAWRSRRAARAAGRAWDLCDTTRCQVYGGTSVETSGGDAAVAETADEARGVSGVPISALFSSSNGGWSIFGGESYLPARADAWDPVNPWDRSVAATCLAARHSAGLGALQALVVTGRDGNGTWGGRVRSLRLEFERGSRTITGSGTPFSDDSAVRTAFFGCGAPGGLRSSWFTVLASPELAARLAMAPLPPPTGSRGADVLLRPAAAGQVSIRWWTAGSGFAAPTGLGGPPTLAGPALVRRPDGTEVAFVTSVAGELWSRTRVTAAAWRPWVRLEASGIGGRPAAAVVDGVTRVVVPRPDRSLAAGTFDAAGAWSGLVALRGQVQAGTGPALASSGPGRLDLVVQGGNRALYRLPWRAGAWREWESVGGILRGEPSLASDRAGGVTALVVGANGAAYAVDLPDGAPGPWRKVGGAFASAPVVAGGVGTMRLDALAHGRDGRVYGTVRTGGVWTAWRAVPGG